METTREQLSAGTGGSLVDSEQSGREDGASSVDIEIEQQPVPVKRTRTVAVRSAVKNSKNLADDKSENSQILETIDVRGKRKLVVRTDCFLLKNKVDGYLFDYFYSSVDDTVSKRVVKIDLNQDTVTIDASGLGYKECVSLMKAVECSVLLGKETCKKQKHVYVEFSNYNQLALAIVLMECIREHVDTDVRLSYMNREDNPFAEGQIDGEDLCFNVAEIIGVLVLLKHYYPDLSCPVVRKVRLARRHYIGKFHSLGETSLLYDKLSSLFNFKDKPCICVSDDYMSLSE